jgi:Zn-dependent peptidase ImmA (M78 family)
VKLKVIIMARADVAARELLDKAGILRPPVNPFEQLGVILVMTAMKDDVSGMLVREPTRTVIGVNEAHASNRQRFTVAHEIGHLQLHKGRPLIMDTDVRVNLRDSVSGMATDREEIEANRFAAALLIPDFMIRNEMSKRRITSAPDLVEHLRRLFEVSAPAMNYRLVNLGVLPTPADI